MFNNPTEKKKSKHTNGNGNMGGLSLAMFECIPGNSMFHGGTWTSTLESPELQEQKVGQCE